MNQGGLQRFGLSKSWDFIEKGSAVCDTSTEAGRQERSISTLPSDSHVTKALGYLMHPFYLTATLCRQLARHFQHTQVWLTKGPHGSRKLDSSLLCLSISTQGQNQGCWGFVDSTSRAEFRHNRGMCPEGSSQALPENPPAHQGSDIKHQHTWWEEGSKRQRDMNRQWFFNSVSEGDLSATCSESLFSHRSWEGPCRAQTQGRATHAFMAAGDGRYYCGWRMG